MAGEIQLNSTTMATESSGSITAELDTIRPNTTNGSLTLQGDSSNAGVTGLTIDSSGNATFAQTISGGTIGSGVTFPSGHVIQTKTDTFTPSSAYTVTTSGDDYLGANLEVTITPNSTSNTLLIHLFIPEYHNNVTSPRAILTGFRYDANFSSGNGTSLGNNYVSGYDNYFGVSGSQPHLQGKISLVYSVLAPVTTTIKIRPYFESYGGDVIIFYNAATSHLTGTLSVQEIQG